MARVEVEVNWDHSRLNAFLVRATSRVAGRYAWRVASQAKTNLIVADRIRTGNLLRSIKAEKINGDKVSSEWTVGTDVFYSKWQEEGRGPVFPIRAKVLRFKPKGSNVYIFRPYAGPAEGAHYLENAVKIVNITDVWP